MNWQQWSGRWNLQPEDKKLLETVLRDKHSDPETLTLQLNDLETRSLLLEDPILVKALIESPEQLSVSPGFYFYVLIRKVLMEAGIDDRSVADYLTMILIKGMKSESSSPSNTTQKTNGFYIIDYLQELAEVTGEVAFYKRADLGDKTLYLSGLFENSIQYRQERWGAPSLAYYESIGKTQYHLVSSHPLSQRYGLGKVYSTLGHSFRTVRHALSHFSDRFISLGEPFFPEDLK